MLGKLVGSQMALEKAAAELCRSGGNTSAADAQLSVLSALQASIGTASAATLAAIKGEIATAVAQSRSLADQAREEANSATAGSAFAMADAAKASRAAVNDAMASLRNIKLTFSSPEDEVDYRQREEERARYIAAQNAKNTPEGNLNAGGAAVAEYEPIDVVVALASFITELGTLGIALLDHFCGDFAEARAALADQYLGCHASLADYVQEVTEEATVIPKALRFYIDWQAMARDAEMSGDLFTIETGYAQTHVFAAR